MTTESGLSANFAMPVPLICVPTRRATQVSMTIAPPAAGSGYGAELPTMLSAARTYVCGMVSLGLCVVVKRQVPPEQMFVQFAITESEPSIIAVPDQVPATSASVSAAGAAAIAAESAGGVSALAQASMNGKTNR